MPKTSEEYEKEIGILQGEISALKAEKQTNLAQVEKLSHSLQDAEKSIKDKETIMAKFLADNRAKLEQQVHALDPSFDCKDKSDDRLLGFLEGQSKIKVENKEHAAAAAAPLMKAAGESCGKTTSAKLKDWLS